MTDKKKKSTGLPKGIRQLPNGRYEARAMINRKTINLYGRDLEKLIEDFETAKERERKGALSVMKDFTLNEWFELWFREAKSRKLKVTSAPVIMNEFKRTFGFYIGEMRLDDIMPMDIQGVLNAMQENGASTKTMNTALSRVRECFDFAIGNKLVKTNPCLAVVVPWVYKETEEEIALTQEEQNNFLEIMDGSWYKEMFYFMCLTGVRVGELGGLKWCDIDFSRKKTRIKRALSYNYVNGHKTEILVNPKTANSVREIPFIGEMEEILMSQREKQKALKAELGERWRGKGELDNLVFTTTMGSPCSRYIVEKEIKKALKQLREKEAYDAMKENREPREIREFHPHSLRHTFATRCFENEMNPKVVQKLMGHSNINITLNIYTHVMESRIEEELAKFGVANTASNKNIVVSDELKQISTPNFTNKVSQMCSV